MPKRQPLRQPPQRRRALPRINPWSVPRTPRKRETRTFTEPDTGVELTLTLQSLDGIGISKAAALGRYYTRTYIEGEDGQEPLPFPAGPNGEDLLEACDREVLQTLALMERMQVSENGTEPYGFMDLLGIARNLPNVWLQMCSWVGTFVQDENLRLGKSPAPPTAR